MVIFWYEYRYEPLSRLRGDCDMKVCDLTRSELIARYGSHFKITGTVLTLIGSATASRHRSHALYYINDVERDSAISGLINPSAGHFLVNCQMRVLCVYVLRS